MDVIPEVIISSDSANEGHNCTIHDLKTGNMIASFKNGCSSPKCLSLVGEDYLLSGCGSPVIKVWRLAETAEENKIVCPGIISSLAVSHCGTFCIAAIENNIHLWEVPTGDLIAVLKRHYQKITCLKFSSDDCCFLSGGEDATVLVWMFPQVISERIQPKIKSHHTWMHHTAAVTDIHIGQLGIYSRVATVSLDMTCKIYELHSGMLLASVCFDAPLYSVTMDQAEYYLMLGTFSGNIFKIDLFENNRSSIHHNEMEKSEFIGHRDKVTCLSVSMMGTYLLSGSDDKTCKLWSITTLSCVRTFRHDGPVTNAFIALKPPVFLTEENILPKLMVAKFSRSFKNPGDEDRVFVSLKSKELRLMHANNPEENFNRVLLQGRPEEIIQGLPNSKSSVFDLSRINLQLYSHALNNKMIILENDLFAET